MLATRDSASWSTGAVPAGHLYYDADLVVANVDDDLADELVLVGNVGTLYMAGTMPYLKKNESGDGAVLWVLDDTEQDLALLKQERTRFNGLEDLRVSAGNTDDDEADEFVVIGRGDSNKAEAVIFDDGGQAFAELKTLQNKSGSYVFGTNNFQRYLSVAMGDLDGDGLAEFAFTAVSEPYVFLEIYDDALGSYVQQVNETLISQPALIGSIWLSAISTGISSTTWSGSLTGGSPTTRSPPGTPTPTSGSGGPRPSSPSRSTIYGRSVITVWWGRPVPGFGALSLRWVISTAISKTS